MNVSTGGTAEFTAKRGQKLLDAELNEAMEVIRAAYSTKRQVNPLTDIKITVGFQIESV